jgi:hypothetical protein
MECITTRRETQVYAPWTACGRRLGDIFTSQARSAERARLIGRTHVRFVVAVRGFEAARESIRFSLIADSPDLRHPITGFVEVRPATSASTSVCVSLVAPLDDGATRYHQNAREAIASLAEVLTTAIEAAARD